MGALFCGFTATAFLGSIGWLFELTSHFRVQYAACLLALAAFFLIRREFRFAAIFAGFTAANLIVLAPWLWGAKSPAQSEGNKLRVMLLNVRTENERYDLVLACINKFRPDLLVLEEVDEHWLKEL